MSLGPIMLDLRGAELQADEREMLLHPLAGGVILFARNYRDPETLFALTSQIHALRKPGLLIAVDHEGGQVQRFHQGFTRLPPGRCFGELYEQDAHRALALVEQTGWLLASELLGVGVDLSFTPVLDLDSGVSSFLGSRVYHRSPEVVSRLGQGLVRGMRDAGMTAVGKHFPGHGNVKGDSHHEIPVDDRSYGAIYMADMLPFERLINAGLAAIMPAHVIYPQVDDKPAGFSQLWLKQVLRGRLNFQGVIFSDDISMAGAEVAGSYAERAYCALDAGCDMVLVCNNQAAAGALLDELKINADPASQLRLIRMHGATSALSYDDLRVDERRLRIAAEVSGLDVAPELELDDDSIVS